MNMKIQPKIDLYQAVNQELEKCVNQAKYLQIRGFNNETAEMKITQNPKRITQNINEPL